MSCEPCDVTVEAFVCVQSGTMEILSHKTKMKTVLNFKQCGWFGKDLHRVEGFIYGPR